jgi:hypothetical protein
MPALYIPIKPLVDKKTGRCAQAEFINISKRHSCFSGGYGNGKSFAASIKALILLCTFPKYRIAICRYSTVDLRRSTMSTFFKLCPPELYEPSKGGNRADSLNYLKLINGSEVFWMHLDDADENTVRGLEVNSVIVDQAEEISENIYNHLSARVGRWDMAEVPPEVLTTDWPRNEETGRPKVPAHMMILCNPDSELHWIYTRYHPESLEWIEKYHKDYEMIQASSTENPTLDPAVLADMMSNDPVWVQRFVFGKWGIPGGAIHEVLSDSILELGTDISYEFVESIRRSGNLYRVLDHGDSSPTCCLWIAAYKHWFFVYREYYKPDALVSDHRREIANLSKWPGTNETEHYIDNWIDPDCVIKRNQKYGGFWSIAEEYLDGRVCDAPGISWNPADNNELATRNRINEYLKRNPTINHPITGQPNAPRLYFVKKKAGETSNLGCYQAIMQTKAQKRMQIDTINGKPIFSDDRDEKITDHAYDCIRYFCAMHPYWTESTQIRVPQGSFMDMRKRVIAMRKSGQTKKTFGDLALRA